MIDTEIVIVGEYDLKLVWHKDKASEEEVEAVRAIIDTMSESQATIQLFEGDFCGDFSWLEPEQIPGALTSAPIIGMDVLLMDAFMENPTLFDDEDDNAKAIINILLWRLQQGGRRLAWYEEMMYVSGDLWYYDRYMLESFLEVLYEHGEVIFDRVRTEEAN